VISWVRKQAAHHCVVGSDHVKIWAHDKIKKREALYEDKGRGGRSSGRRWTPRLGANQDEHEGVERAPGHEEAGGVLGLTGGGLGRPELTNYSPETKKKRRDWRRLVASELDSSGVENKDIKAHLPVPSERRGVDCGGGAMAGRWCAVRVVFLLPLLTER
jgi:hypothetical protein